MPQNEPITANELLQRQVDELRARITQLEQQIPRLRDALRQDRWETRG